MSAPFNAILNRSTFVGQTFVGGVVKNSRLRNVTQLPFAAAPDPLPSESLHLNGDFSAVDIIDSILYGTTTDHCIFDEVARDLLRRDQRDLLNAVLEWFARFEERAARLTCPVAYGKTHLMPFLLHEVAERFGLTTLGFSMPWITLANQTTLRVLTTLVELGGINHKYRVIIRHSGTDLTNGNNSNDDDAVPLPLRGKVFKSKDPKKVIEKYNEWIAEGCRVIFAYTYDSASVVFDTLIEGNISIEFSIHDEAHNLSRNSKFFTEIVASVVDPAKVIELAEIRDVIDDLEQERHRTSDKRKNKPYIDAMQVQLAKRAGLLNRAAYKPNDKAPIKRTLSMTATPTSNVRRGSRAMDNEAVFGKEIFNYTFPKLAALGEAITPKISVIASDHLIAEKVATSKGIRSQDLTNVSNIIKALLEAEEYLGDRPVKGIVTVSSTMDIEACAGEVYRRTAAGSQEDKDDWETYLNGDYRELVETSGASLKRLIREATGHDYVIVGISGHLNRIQREERFARFEEATHAIFVNCKVLTEGVNITDLNTSVLLRSADAIEVVQQGGRITRIGSKDRAAMQSEVDTLIPNAAYEGYEKDKAIFLIGDRVNTDPDKVRMTIMKETLENYFGYGEDKDGGFKEGAQNTEWLLGGLNDEKEVPAEAFNRIATAIEVLASFHISARTRKFLEDFLGISKPQVDRSYKTDMDTAALDY